jgi:hypothetical protein
MNLEKIDNGLKKAAVVLGIMGGAAFTGLYPIWVGVIASFAGVLCGALATSPVFSTVPESAWNRAMQALAALFAASAGSSQLEAVQKLLSPAHPVWAAKLGLGAMLGAQIFAYLAQRGGGPTVGTRAVMVALLGAFAFGSVGCAHITPIVQACKDCVAEQGPQDLKDLEAQAGPFIEHVMMCDPTFDPAAIPPCVKAGLESVVAAMGPDGLRFRDCVLAKIEVSESAPPLAKARSRAVRVRLARGLPL